MERTKKYHLLLEGAHVHAPVRVGVGVRLLESPSDRIHLLARPLQRHTRREAGDDRREAFRGALGRRVPSERVGEPELHVLGVPWQRQEAELLRHHADHRVRCLVHEDGLYQDLRVRAEAPTPQVVGEDHDRPAVWPVLFGEERAPEGRLHAEDREEARRDPAAHHPLRLSLAGEGDRIGLDRRHVLEHGVALPPVEEVRRRGGEAGEPLRRLPDHDQAVRVRVGEPAQEDGVHDAENRCGGADAEGEREEHDGRESRAPAEGAKGEAEVLENCFEHTRDGRS